MAFSESHRWRLDNRASSAQHCLSSFVCTFVCIWLPLRLPKQSKFLPANIFYIAEKRATLSQQKSVFLEISRQSEVVRPRELVHLSRNFKRYRLITYFVGDMAAIVAAGANAQKPPLKREEERQNSPLPAVDLYRWTTSQREPVRMLDQMENHGTMVEVLEVLPKISADTKRLK